MESTLFVCEVCGYWEIVVKKEEPFKFCPKCGKLMIARKLITEVNYDRSV